MLIRHNDDRNPPPPAPAVPVAVAPAPTPEEKEVFVVAQNQDVEIFRVPGNGHNVLVVGEHPLEDAPLILAKNADLEVLSFGGVLPNESAPEEPGATMIWPPQKKVTIRLIVEFWCSLFGGSARGTSVCLAD